VRARVEAVCAVLDQAAMGSAAPPPARSNAAAFDQGLAAWAGLHGVFAWSVSM
jgi:hypothetical protein